MRLSDLFVSVFSTNRIEAARESPGYKPNLREVSDLLRSLQEGSVSLGIFIYLRKKNDNVIIMDGLQRLITLMLIAKVYGAYKYLFKDFRDFYGMFVLPPDDLESHSLTAVLCGGLPIAGTSVERVYNVIRRHHQLDIDKSATLVHLKESLVEMHEFAYYDDDMASKLYYSLHKNLLTKDS